MEMFLHRLNLGVLRVLQIPRASLIRTRQLSASANGNGDDDVTKGEQELITKLQESFPKATEIRVSDVSGGCGAMYQILIEAPDFAGKRTVLQHRMVNEALKEQIKEMHGLQLTTKISPS